MLVGHAERAERRTGCTVLLCPQGAVAGVAVRGGSPGTRETDLLRPENVVDRVHGVLLAGGSAFGLDAAAGVMRWLEEQGHGWPVGDVVRVPIVPAAVLFDLWWGDARIRPDAGTGYAACAAAQARAPAQGAVGAGAGASFDKQRGLAEASQGGVGTASARVGSFIVGALVVVNAIGRVLDERNRPLRGRRIGAGTGSAAAARPAGADAGGATTIGVVATDAALTKAQATALAALAHHGLSRAIHPIGVHDGDTLFALATGGAGMATPAAGELGALGAAAADMVAAAIRNAVRAAGAVNAA